MSEKNSLAVSYIVLRQLIGLLGILLPFVCILGGLLFANNNVESSISAYYHTNMRDFFVGLLVCVGLFMSTYGGYTRIDRIISAVLAITAVGIAFFPCRFDSTVFDRVGIFHVNPAVANILHLISAGTFFVLLAFNSFFLFTKTSDRNNMTIQKMQRNRIYKICGIVIFACCILDVIFVSVLSDAQIESSKIVLILEAIMLLAFGTSWLVKGEAILKDKVVNSNI